MHKTAQPWPFYAFLSGGQYLEKGFLLEVDKVKERLQKMIAAAGVASRRHAEQLITSGRVRVNRKTVTQLGTKVDPVHDFIEVDGKMIKSEEKHTYLFYKPTKVITSMKDPRGRRVVADYFKNIPVRLYPVGRLDYDTEGLLLMTNDGKLANRMMHPRFEIEKSYLAFVKGIPSDIAIKQLSEGIELDDGLTAPAQVSLVRANKTSAWIRLVLHEGRNRQVRRMCDAVNHPVKKLVRERIAFLRIGSLKAGEYRSLTEEETNKLRRLLF